MAVDFLRTRWQDPHATRNGRRGQRQDGVDIVGHPPWLKGKTAGAQCKNTDSLTLATVIGEVEKAKKFKGELSEFLLVAAADRDGALQAEVREHFQAHPAPFHVEMVFWPDVVADLSSDEQLVAKHWKGFPTSPPAASGLPPPAWIDREAVRDNETAECQCELTLSIPAPGLDLDSSELASELITMAREGMAGRVFGVLLGQAASRTEQKFKWEGQLRQCANEILKWELEVADHGVLTHRWAKFRDDIRLLGITALIERVFASISRHRLALERAARRLGVGKK
jgi:hypothetical protein